MLLKIQQTSTAFAKIDMKQHKRPAFQAASSFFETNREIPACFFQNCRKFLEFKTSTPGQRKLSKNRTPGSKNVRISGGRQGGWSGLELTDTLIFCDDKIKKLELFSR